MQAKAFWVNLKHLSNRSLLAETYTEWSRDNAGRLAAALAYYAATSLAPLVVGLISIAGFVLSAEQAQDQLVRQVIRFVGPQGGEVVHTIVENADQPQLAQVAGVVSLLLLLWSASNIFRQLQDSLDTVWGIELRKDLPLWQKMKHRLIPLLVVLGAGLLLLLAIVASTVLAALAGLVSALLPGGAFVWQIANFLISLAVITLLFALIFKWLPDVEMAWRDVWPGAVLTAALFVLGQFVLSWYFGRQSGTSLYGAAGSLIVLLLWLYYSAQIFLFGAEFTQVYATRYGQGVRARKDAVARGAESTVKPAAMATGGRADPGPGRGEGRNTKAAAWSWQRAIAPLDRLSTSELVLRLIDDGRALLRHEMALAQAEVRQSLARLARGATLVAGGGMMIYAAALLALLTLVLMLWALMPLWLAFLLVGVLALMEGWIVMVWAQERLRLWRQ